MDKRIACASQPELGHPPVDRAAAIAQASWGLFETNRHHSAKSGLTAGQGAYLLGCVAGVVGLTLITPELTAMIFRTLAYVGFFLLIIFRALCLTSDGRKSVRRVADIQGKDKDLPVYSVIVPVYREAYVLAGLVAALDRMDYPKARLDILIAVEMDDHATALEARTLARARPWVRVVHVPAIGPKTKPKACNYALAFARGEFVTIYDAEDRPQKTQLREAVARFRTSKRHLICLQAPLVIRNERETWLSRLFALEYAAHFFVVLPALAHWGWVLPLGGTSNHFRANDLKHIGGWDPHNVTEDADIGFRLARECKGEFGILRSVTIEECPTRRRTWCRQRRRWIKGHIQTWFVQMRRPAALSAKAHAALHLTIGAGVLSAFLHVPFVLVFSAIALFHPTWIAPFDIVFLAAGFGIAIALQMLGAKRAFRPSLIPLALTSPAYWWLHTLAAGQAIADLILRPFHWFKTEHGASCGAPSTLRPTHAAAGNAPDPSRLGFADAFKRVGTLTPARRRVGARAPSLDPHHADQRRDRLPERNGGDPDAG